jgi:acyl-CoA synthetase (AMP-forming)/AMP-acid ligase II
VTLTDRIETVLAIDPAAPAIEFEGNWCSWGDLAAAMRALRAAVEETGANRIGVLMRNHIAIVPAFLEVLRAHHSLVVFNPMLPRERLAADIGASGVPVLVGIAADLDHPEVESAWKSSQCLVVEMTGDAQAPAHVRQRGDGARSGPAEPDVAVEMLTSGTTGPPKRIPMPWRTLEDAVFAAARFEKGRAANDTPRLRDGVQLVMAPFSHIGGVFAVLNAIAAGRKMTLLPKFSVEGFRDVVKRHGIKAASTPPAALKMILDADIPKEDLATLRAFRSGTAPLDPELAEAIYARYGIPVLQNYGATEFGGGVAGWTIDDFHHCWSEKRGSVGRLNPGIEGRIVDPDTDVVMNAGEQGVLELRSRQIGDGVNWLRTTDLAKIDADGFLWILGRADNAIIRGGFKIQPDDIVRAMESHPAIVEAAVTALPDERLGAVPGAAYRVRAGEPIPSAVEIEAYLKSRLTGYQVPAVLRPLDEFPRTASMKVDQAALRALLVTD